MESPPQEQPSDLDMIISSFGNSHDSTMNETKAELKDGR